MSAGGSDDGNIHSLKLGEVAAEAELEIAQLTSQIQNQISQVTLYLSSMMTKKKKWKSNVRISSLSLQCSNLYFIRSFITLDKNESATRRRQCVGVDKCTRSCLLIGSRSIVYALL